MTGLNSTNINLITDTRMYTGIVCVPPYWCSTI